MHISLKIALLFLILATFTSCTNKIQKPDKIISDREKSCMENVIKEDSINGTARNHNCEKIPLSETIKIYASSMEKINFEDCPNNFVLAFENHKNAWTSMLKITDKYPNLRGEMHDLFEILENGKDKEEFKRLLKAVWTTWAEVEKALPLQS